MNDPALLDELPYAPGLLNDAPAAIREALYAAFDIQCLYREDKNQVTIWATITSTTPGVIAALTADPRTDSDSDSEATPATALFADLQATAIAAETDEESGGRAPAETRCVPARNPPGMSVPRATMQVGPAEGGTGGLEAAGNADHRRAGRAG